MSKLLAILHSVVNMLAFWQRRQKTKLPPVKLKVPSEIWKAKSNAATALKPDDRDD